MGTFGMFQPSVLKKYTHIASKMLQAYRLPKSQITKHNIKNSQQY